MKGVRARIAPSILSADFSRLADDVARIEAGGADLVHIDVMDGCFVPNLTFGTKVIETVRRLTTLPLDVHMMVVQPEKYFEDFAQAGATGLTIHAEVAPHMHRQIYRIKELGCDAGAHRPLLPVVRRDFEIQVNEAIQKRRDQAVRASTIFDAIAGGDHRPAAG